MKKFLPALVLISFLGVLLIPIVASADVMAPECCKLKRNFPDINEKCKATKYVGPAGGYCPGTSSKVPDETPDEWAMCCLFNTIYNATDWVFTIFIAMTVIMIIIGAYFFLTGSGELTAVTKGKQYIFWALIGLLVAFLAKAVPSIAKLIMGI